MSGIRILLAEDDSNLRKLIAKYLETEGYSVFSAEDGEKALDIWYETPADLAILDVMMPNANGWEVLSEIREDSDIPVIMLTARGFAIEDEKKEQLKIAECLSKPFSPREVLKCIEETLVTCSVA